MKKICLLTALLFAVCTANAQTEFSVPTRTLQQKYDLSKMIANNYIIAFIIVAKSDGMTAGEIGKKCGEAFIPFWDKNTGFEQIVNWNLLFWSSLQDSVKIVEQSNNTVVITAPHIDGRLENQGDLVGVSLEEFIAYLKATNTVICNHFDVGFDMTWGEEGLKIKFTK
jgi:hypothetical protein